MSRTRPVVLVAALLAAAAPATAQIAGTVTTVDGRTLKGRLSVDEAGTARIESDAGATELDFAELVAFEQDGVSARNVAVDNRVWLRSGQELPVKKLSGRAAADGKPAVLVAQLPCGAELELPISTLRALRQGGLMRPQPTLFAQDLEAPADNDDLIYVVKDGKALRSSVAVTAITAKKIDFVLRDEAYDFDLDGLCAVVFGNNTGFPPDRQPRPRAVVVTTTGERVEGRLLSLGENVRCRLDEGCVLELPARRLHRLEVSSDKLVWLSELKPAVEQTPAFDRVWPWHIDRSVAGPGFEISGKQFTRGIGLVPRTRLTYSIDGRFDVFEAMIGIDDRGGPQAHAVFRVFVDGEAAFESKPKTRGQPAEHVRVDVTGKKQLTIEVDFGKNYDLGDFCAFADARVVQK